MPEVKQALLDYIKKEEEKGFDESTIRKALAKVGYSEEVIAAAFEKYNFDNQKDEHDHDDDKPLAPTAAGHAQPQVKVDHHYWRWVVFIIVLLVGFVFLYSTLDFSEPTLTEETPFEERAEEVSVTEEDVVIDQKPQRTALPLLDTLGEVDSTDATLLCNGVVQSNVSSCREITDSDAKARCFYYNSLLRMQRKESTLCRYNSNPRFKSMCLYTARKQSQECGNHCDVVAANLAHDATLCDPAKDYCVVGIYMMDAHNNQNTQACAAITNSAEKQTCLAVAAQKESC